MPLLLQESTHCIECDARRALPRDGRTRSPFPDPASILPPSLGTSGAIPSSSPRTGAFSQEDARIFSLGSSRTQRLAPSLPSLFRSGRGPHPRASRPPLRRPHHLVVGIPAEPRGQLDGPHEDKKEPQGHRKGDDGDGPGGCHRAAGMRS